MQGPAIQVAVKVVDTELYDGGLLVGRVVDSEGEPGGETEVTLRTSDAGNISVTSDEQGRFAFAGVPGGTYQLTSDGSSVVIRAWAVGTAPPSAVRQIELIERTTIRGQWSPAPPAPERIRRYMMEHPYVIGGVFVAAVMVPLVVDDLLDDDDAS